MELILIFLGALIFFSHIFNSLFEKTHIPKVLILMCIGLIIGPVLGLASPKYLGRIGTLFTTITLIVILYESGTRLSISSLTGAIKAGTMLSIINFLVAIGIGLFVGYYIIGLDIIASAFLGTTVGSISSAVVIPMLKQLKLGKKAEDIMFLEAALSDVVCLVGALAIFNAMDTGILHVGNVVQTLLVSFFFAILIGIIAGFAWMFILRNIIPHFNNGMFTSFALAFMLYGLCELLGVNGGIAILTFGFMVGNMGDIAIKLDKKLKGRNYFKDENAGYLKADERNFYSEIAFIMQTYFFVYIGMSIQLSNLYLVLMGLFFVSLTFIARIPPIMALGRKDLSPRDKKMMYILNPKGLISGVLASLPLQAAITAEQIHTGEVIQGIVYASVLFSIVICSVFVFIFEKRDKKNLSVVK